MNINYWFLTASILCVLMVFIHVFVGGPKLAKPIQESDLTKVVRAVSAVAWHAVTANYLLMAIALLSLSLSPSQNILATYIIVQLIAQSVLFLSYSISRFRTITTLYLWPVFLIIALVVFMGT